MKKSAWFKTDLGYYSTKDHILKSRNLIADGQDSKGRFSFSLKGFKDVTYQVTKHAKLGIFYPEEVEVETALERLKPLLLKADGSPAETFREIRSKRGVKRPKLVFGVTQKTFGGSQCKRKLPSVGFNLRNVDSAPWIVRIKIRVFLGERDLGLIRSRIGHYDGTADILCEPGEGFVNGNFSVPSECVNSEERLAVEVRVIAVDLDEKEYPLFPKSWIYVRDRNAWFYEPTALAKPA